MSGARTEAEELARGCGLRFLEASDVYERSVVAYGAGHGTLAIIGLVARQRRLLRVAYLLADADQRLEASVFVRAMQEFLIRQKWLALDPELHHVLWSLDDVKARLRIDDEVTEWTRTEGDDVVGVLKPEVRLEYERQRAWLTDEIEKIRKQRGLLVTPSYPNLREQATQAGLTLVYSLAYRFDSQSAAHPSVLAVEQLLQDRPDLGGVEVLADPPADRAYADPYAVGAFLLRDALANASEHLPEFRLDAFDEIAETLEGVKPRPSDEPRVRG